MSSKTKTIALSVTALLAVAGGIYAFTAGGEENAVDSKVAVNTAQAPAQSATAETQETTGQQSGDKASVQEANPAMAQQPAASEQPAAQAPKKLTREQLMPPPATEEEKLQKAAQQESNF